ncbi:MAG TPA: indole-3-glycerol-phosphate synthase [Humidesulfovibrio sp.]|uniref:indole-3-glycerol-phosphate synthase n=1 Tax=Humidesulfovibrio sp. TaxID=2910988 RepID=UPI002C46F46C|nr:indole-3-glycerol-phosphate synthase [Humidesulfovibrio sp.]HWR03135.1 indole-3-glycerol-phosphate synthase [Humidesulfovibrio sp.]
MLARFREAQLPGIARLRRLEAAGQLPAPMTYPGRQGRPSFSRALRAAGSPAVIAEYKRASPSRGVINLDLSPADVAKMYADNGAAAFSVLTEEAHFQGSLQYLADMAFAGVPMLRKDFLLDLLQVAETAATPASALLLIMRMFDGADDVREMIERAREHGIEAVCEVFDEADLDMARWAGAEIIQVNNRDLDTLVTDLDVSRRLVGTRGAGELWISASGLETPQQVEEMGERGFDAVLIGTSLMSRPDPGAALRELSQVGVRRKAEREARRVAERGTAR